MRHIALQLLFSSLLLSLAAPSLQAQSSGNAGASIRSADERALLERRDAWYDAYFRGDADALNRYETEDFVVVSPSGAQGIEGRYEGIGARAREGRWFPPATGKVSEDVRVRYFGDQALITDRSWNRRAGESPTEPIQKTRLTELWVRRNGEWQVAHLQYAPEFVDTAGERKVLEELVKRRTPDLLSEDILFASGAYDHLIQGVEELKREAEARSQHAPRPNEKTEREIVRIEVATSGDMAYIVSNGRITWDGPGGTWEGFNNSSINVLRKTPDGWKVVATFAHPWPDPKQE